MPWILLPLLPLLTGSLTIFGGVRVWPAYLLVPVAAWLASRYGSRGVVTVALGTALALVPPLQLGAVQIAGALGLYVIALWVAIVASTPDPLQTLTGSSSPFRSMGLLVAALIVLPLSVSLGSHAIDDETQLILWFGLRPLLLFALFLFGLCGLPPKPAVTAMSIAILTGIAIRLFGIEDMISALIAAKIDPTASSVDVFRLRYGWNDLAAFATGLACFFAGRLVLQGRAGQQEMSALWRHPYLVVALLTLLAALDTASWQLLYGLPEAASVTGVYGDYFALPVAGFLAGLLLRHAGVAVCLVLFVGLVAGSNLLSLSMGQSGLSAALEQPLICLAYGMLGIATRTQADAVAVPFKAKRWLQYALLVIGIIAVVTSESELASLAAALLVAIGGALAAAAVQWLRGSLKGRGVEISGEGWLLLAAIVVLVTWAAVNGRTIVSMLFSIAADYDMTEGMALIAVILLLHIPAALVAAGLSACLPKVWSDIRSLLGRRA